jgi:hypothetical protein
MTNTKVHRHVDLRAGTFERRRRRTRARGLQTLRHVLRARREAA